MDIKRFSEYYLCDAIRLAQTLGGEISDGIGNAWDFPLSPKAREIVGDDIRFLRVQGDDYYEIGYISSEKPKPENLKLRNKSIHRVLVGREIRRARLDLGLSIEKLAQKTNLRPHSLERIEEGRWDIDIALLGIILDALGKEIKIL